MITFIIIIPKRILPQLAKTIPILENLVVETTNIVRIARKPITQKRLVTESLVFP
jgi:DNA-directed RNA polymerase subunit H (RpoH/RPB5)